MPRCLDAGAFGLPLNEDVLGLRQVRQWTVDAEIGVAKSLDVVPHAVS
jgi:hypothetical protein